MATKFISYKITNLSNSYNYNPDFSFLENEKVLLFTRQNEIRGVELTMPYYNMIPPLSLPKVRYLFHFVLIYIYFTFHVIVGDINLNT